MGSNLTCRDSEPSPLVRILASGYNNSMPGGWKRIEKRACYATDGVLDEDKLCLMSYYILARCLHQRYCPLAFEQHVCALYWYLFSLILCSLYLVIRFPNKMTVIISILVKRQRTFPHVDSFRRDCELMLSESLSRSWGAEIVSDIIPRIASAPSRLNRRCSLFRPLALHRA